MLVFVEDPAQALASSYVQVGDLVRVDDRRRQRPQWAGIGDALMGAVPVVEAFELRKACSRWRWFQIKVRSSSSRRQVCTHRSMIELDNAVNDTLSR